MPLRFKSTNKMTRTNRRKAPVKKAGPRLRRFKSQAAAARYGRTPYAGRYASKPRVAHHKMVVRQEGLGQQTETKMALIHLGKRDTRANLIKKIGEASTYLYTKTFDITSPIIGGVITTGRQATSSRYIAIQADLRNIAESLQNYLATGSSSSGSPLNAPARFLLENAHCVYDFSNRSTAPVTLKMYIVTNKRDTWDPPSGNVNDFMNFNSPNGAVVRWNGYPIDAFRAGIQATADPFQSTSTDGAWENPGTVPTNSPIFNQYFKIEREMEVEMSTGGVHRLELHIPYDKMCDATVYANTPYVGIRGLTRFLVFCAVGSPVKATDNTMTTAGVDIGCIETVKYRYTQSWAPAGLNFQNSDTPLTQESAAAALQINAGSGASSTVQFA